MSHERYFTTLILLAVYLSVPAMHADEDNFMYNYLETRINEVDKKYMREIQKLTHIIADLKRGERISSSSTLDENVTRHNLTEFQQRIEYIEEQIQGEQRKTEMLTRNSFEHRMDVSNLNRHISSLRNAMKEEKYQRLDHERKLLSHSDIQHSSKCVELTSNGVMHVKVTSQTIGDKATFLCIPPHKLQGSKYLHCQPNGEWSGTIPTCYLRCPDIIMTGGLIVTKTKEANTTIARFNCSPGFKLRGSPIISCLHGMWDKTKPWCVVSSLRGVLNSRFLIKKNWN